MSKRKPRYAPLPQRETLTPEEVAAFLQVSTEVIYDLLQDDEIPARRVGRQWRIFRAKFLHWYDPDADPLPPAPVGVPATRPSLTEPFTAVETPPLPRVSAPNQKGPD